MKWVNSGFIFYYPHQSERNCLSLILPILLVMWISPTDLPTKLSETSVDAKPAWHWMPCPAATGQGGVLRTLLPGCLAIVTVHLKQRFLTTLRSKI